jgi:hypothetical protein
MRGLFNDSVSTSVITQQYVCNMRNDIDWELERTACLIVTYYLDFYYLNREETFKNLVRNSQGTVLNLNFGIFQIPISTVHNKLRS